VVVAVVVVVFLLTLREWNDYWWLVLLLLLLGCVILVVYQQPASEKKWLKNWELKIWDWSRRCAFVVIPALILGLVIYLIDDDGMYKGLPSLIPALMLLPVMIAWNKLLVTLMPSIKQGASSNRESSDPIGHHFNLYYALITFYSSVCVIWFLIAILQKEQSMTSKDVKDMGMTPTNVSLGMNSEPFWNPYPICNTKWGAPGLQLGVLDMAILSKYAYADNDTTFEEGLDASFREAGFDDVTTEMISNFSEIPRMAVVKMASSSEGGINSTNIVLAIKGTSNAAEAFADASYYSGVALLGFMSTVVDIFDLVPNELIAFFLNHLRLPLVTNLENQILDIAIAKITELKKKYKNASFVITGHSLGGGIAGAVGANTSTPTITFSAPGSHFGRFVFKTNRSQMKRTVNVWPDRDFVPKVDRHDAFLQNIDCPAFVTAAECHLIGNTICELWRSCGDSRKRNFPQCWDTHKVQDYRVADTSFLETMLLFAGAFVTVIFCACCWTCTTKREGTKEEPCLSILRGWKKFGRRAKG